MNNNKVEIEVENPNKKILKELNKIRFETERERSILHVTSLGRADLSKLDKRLKILNQIETLL